MYFPTLQLWKRGIGMVNVTLGQAIKLLREHATHQVESEWVMTREAGGRLLAQDIYAPFSQPPFHRSPLDGYAFLSASSEGASKESPVFLKVIGEVCAGHKFQGKVEKGEAVRIMTGAPIPEGCDCVLRQEDTDYGETIVAIYKSLKPYSNYCFAGEDIKEGHLILKKGEKLSAITLGILASMGINKVQVQKKIRIGLLCTGDELVPLGSPLLPGKIYNSNGVMLEARIRELGIEVMVVEQCVDAAGQVGAAIEDLIEKVDLIITTGGVSVGKKDIMHDVFKDLNVKRLFWRIAIQPGTPVLAGCFKEKLIIGLSGNPFAALVNFELLVRAVVAELGKMEDIMPKQVKGHMMSEFNKASQKRRFIRAKYCEGKVSLDHNNHSSGSLYTMSLCNCLIDIPAGNEGLHIGDEVNVILL